MKGTGAKRNICPSCCVSTGAKFPVAPVESAPMVPGGNSRATLYTVQADHDDDDRVQLSSVHVP